MRILHVLHNSLPLVSGYGIRSGYIVRLQREEGFELQVVTSAQHPNGPAAQEEIDGVVHVRTPGYHGVTWPIAREWGLMNQLERQLTTVVREFRPDIVHAHSPVLVGLPAARVARRAKLPLVYEVRDLWENASVDRGRFRANSALYRLARALETRMLRRADAVVTICETLRTELAPRAGAPGKVHVIANGVDVDFFTPSAEVEGVRQRFGMDGRRVILYAGSFQPYEGLELLIQAMTEIAVTAPDAHLLIAGGSASLAYPGAVTKGTAEDALPALVSRLGLLQRVTFTGRVPHADIKGLYSIADVVVYPRTLTLTTALTTPLKPLEAMAMARAVLVSDVYPHTELVQNGETGLTFTAGSAASLARQCVRLLGDAPARARFGQAARAFVVARRQWSDLVAGYRAIYERARAEHARPHRLGR